MLPRIWKSWNRMIPPIVHFFKYKELCLFGLRDGGFWGQRHRYSVPSTRGFCPLSMTTEWDAIEKFLLSLLPSLTMYGS